MSMDESSVSTRVLVILLWSMLHRCYGVHAGIQSSNIVVMPVPVVSSQYFNMLEIAEEMARRGNEVPIITFACIFSLFLGICLELIFMWVEPRIDQGRGCRFKQSCITHTGGKLVAPCIHADVFLPHVSSDSDRNFTTGGDRARVSAQL